MSTFSELRAICGDAHVAPATAADALLGVSPRWIARPGTTDEVVALLRFAAVRQLRTVVRGSGTKLHWGPAPSQIDLILDTSRLVGVVSHDPAERVATVRGGTPLHQPADAFAGQRLVLDSPGGGTVGGAIAIGVGGPLGTRYGGISDQIVDITVVRGDGPVVRCPGGAPTGIPGHDIASTMTGGWGALGVITEATLRLHPTPPVTRWVVRRVSDPAKVRELLQPLCPVDPAYSVVEIESVCAPGNTPPDEMAIELEGSEDEVEAQVAKVRDHVEGEVRDAPPAWWRRCPFSQKDVALLITTPPGEIFSAAYIVRDGAGEIPVRLRWSPAVATMYAVLPGDAPTDRIQRLVEGIRQTLIARGGACRVLHAPEPIRAGIDMWGPVTDRDSQLRIKQEYDPYGLLAPGRFITDDR